MLPEIDHNNSRNHRNSGIMKLDSSKSGSALPPINLQTIACEDNPDYNEILREYNESVATTLKEGYTKPVIRGYLSPTLLNRPVYQEIASKIRNWKKSPVAQVDVDLTLELPSSLLGGQDGFDLVHSRQQQLLEHKKEILSKVKSHEFYLKAFL